ncbi:MAG: hypothetical protein U0350_19205 [Caldilineaceae bacterium]
MKVKVVFITVLLFCTMKTELAVKAQTTFVAPTNVALTIYQLNNDGSLRPFQCSNGDTFFGCTAYCDNREALDQHICTGTTILPYPYSSGTVTLTIDGPAILDTNNNGDYSDDAVNAYNPQQRYLWDVVTREYGLQLGSQSNKPLAGVAAQAIAVRTYIYQRIANGYSIDNSTNFQVFIPYSYVALLPQAAQQDRLLQALKARYYVTTTADDKPIEALYGTDNGAVTRQGKLANGTLIPYRKAVVDPISAAYGAVDDGTSNGGMSSRGASRWSLGHTSSRGPVAVGQPNYPHDSGGYGDFWSVRWDNPLQILTHYYTGIHVRDANNGNAIITPRYRWTPLKMAWPTNNGQPPNLACSGRPLQVVFWIQNTGTEVWPAGGVIGFNYVDIFSGQTAQASASGANLPPTQDIAPGGAYTVTLPYVVPQPPTASATTVTPYFQMYSGATPFNQVEPGKFWPAYTPATIGLVACAKNTFLPLIQQPRVVGQ